MTNRSKCQLLLITWAATFFPFIGAIGQLNKSKNDLFPFIFVVVFLAAIAIWVHMEFHIKDDIK